MHLDNQNETNMDDQLKPKPKGKWGGPRPNSGRPRRMEEKEIIEKLRPMAAKAFKQLEMKIEEGDMNAIKLFCAYFIGLPTQKIENKIEGQLNQVSVEVVRPVYEEAEIVAN